METQARQLLLSWFLPFLWSGWSLWAVWCVELETCSERLVLNSTWGIITDGPEDYHIEAHCEWLIRAAVPGQVINLEFLDIMTECSYDQVLVYDGSSYEDKLLGAFSGDTLPHPLYALSGYMLVYFYTDYNYIGRGFTAVYSVTDCPFNCSSTSGICDLPSHKCVCNTGYTGESCQNEFCPGNCNNHGSCDMSTQRCLCDTGYAGYGCSLPLTPSVSTNSLHYDGRWFDIMPADSGFTPRASHAGVFVEQENSLFVFGGKTLTSVLDELIKYDFNQNKWVEIQKRLPWPKDRHSHTMCVYQGKIFLFGGVLENGRHSNELWVYDISANLWLDKTTESGTIITPKPVASHTLTLVDNHMYLFGGRTMEGRFLSDMYSINLNSSYLHWKEVVPRGGKKELRRLAGHSAVYHKESRSLLIYGGLTPDNARFPFRSNSLHAFHISENYWTELVYDTSNLGHSDYYNPPQLRAFHSAAILGNYMVIYGGNSHIHHKLEVCYDDGIYFYHLGCHAWVDRTKLEESFGSVTKSNPQRGRFSMVAVPAFGNTLLIAGGYRGNVLGDLLAYRVPVSVARHQNNQVLANLTTHCPLHRQEKHCKYDSECVWCTGGLGEQSPRCVARSLKQQCSDELPDNSCQSICSTLLDCGACTVQGQGAHISADSLPGYWHTDKCSWCVKEAKCVQQGRTLSPTDSCHSANGTESHTVGWWGGKSPSLVKLAQCRVLDYPAGMHYIAFDNPHDFNHPDQVEFVRVSGTNFVMRHPLKSDSDFKNEQQVVRLRGYIYPLGTRHHSHDKHLKLLLAGSCAAKLFVSTDEFQSNKELVAEIASFTYQVHPANRTGNQPMFVNESRGAKYFTEIQISRTVCEGAKAVSMEWTGVLDENIDYRQKLTYEFLEPYNTNNCSYFDTCLACMMDTSCGWCELSGLCYQRSDPDKVCSHDVPSHVEVELVTNPLECATCEDRIGCHECLQGSSCEWLLEKSRCWRRGRFPQAQKDLNQCATPCHQRDSCKSCISVKDECVWCETTKSCFPFVEYISRYSQGGCSDWVDMSGNGSCPDCSRHRTAPSCLTEFRCGWCGNDNNPTLGKCIEGDFKGPSNGVNCTDFLQSVHNISGLTAWSYGMLPNLDECRLGLDECHANATCINTYKSYECVCNKGFTGNGRELCDRTCYYDCIHGTCSHAPHYECLCEMGWTGPECDTNCGCHNHSSCSTGVGKCDKCQDLTQGTQCELCIPGAYGDATTATGCVSCECHGHGDLVQGVCDKVTGHCFCKDNARGEHCQKCQDGYYGDPRNGGKCYLSCHSKTVVSNVTEGSLGSYRGSGVNEDTSQVYCLWILTVHPALDWQPSPVMTTPTISFIMETSLKVACMQDHVYVYDGIPEVVQGRKTQLGDSSTLIGSFCGDGLESEVSVVAQSGYLTVLFQGYQALAGDRTFGFNASYHVNSCPNHCHGNRACDMGRCVCKPKLNNNGAEFMWYGGADCQLSLCPEMCGGRGSCDTQDTKLCRCENGSGGLGCEQNVTSTVITLQTDTERSQGLGVYTNSLPRMGHGMASCGENDLYMFGGYSLGLGVLSDLWKLDLNKTEWSEMPVEGTQSPSGRYFHSMLCDVEASLLYIYGGLSVSLQAKADIWSYDLNTFNWTQVKPLNQTSIPKLAGHTMTYIGSGRKVFVIGGFSTENYFSSKTYLWNLTTQEWSVLQTTGFPPIGMYGHSAVYHTDSNAIYVFGGYSFHVDSVSPSNRLFSLDLAKKRWSVLPSAIYTQPEPRYFHSAVSTNDYMIVYGGKMSQDHVTSDIITFYSYSCNRWTTLLFDEGQTAATIRNLSQSSPRSMFTGVKPIPLFGSTATYSHGDVYIFGGLHSTTRGLLYKVEFPQDICTTYRDLHSCNSDEGQVSYNHSSACDRDLVEGRDCHDYSTCSECLAQWPAHRGHNTVCKWCTQCMTGKCIPVNSDCGNENPCKKLQSSLNTSDACMLLKCHASDCHTCYGLGDCVWTFQHKRDGEIGYLVNEEPKYNHNCISRDDLKTSPIAMSQANICSKSCTELTDCKTCLASKGNDGGAIECVWSTHMNKCMPLHSLPLYCLAGQCGHVLQGPQSLCPTPCGSFNRCDTCLVHPHCGWCTTETNNGVGVCVEGGLDGPLEGNCDKDISESMSWGVFVWAYIECPLENECKNDHHDCDVNEDCVDLERGYQCHCQQGFNRTTIAGVSSCQPVCDQGCEKGNCSKPNVCDCDFGYVGKNCSLECLCNGHSECLGESEKLRKSCVRCHNDTMGAQCQLCEPLFVGNPVNGGMCHSCLHFCHNHSDVCMSTAAYDRSIANPQFGQDMDSVLSWLVHGPKNASDTVCVSCEHNARGANCSQCEPGYFRLSTDPTEEPCRRCQCHGHSGSCENTTGQCHGCQNNTQSSCTNEPDSEPCWKKQCSQCTDKYHGTPTDGHQCYLEMAVKIDYCYQSNTRNKCCFDPYTVAECTTKPTVLAKGKTLFYAIQPQYVNVDIRIVLDVTVGGLDVYLSPFEDTWVVYNDETTWEHVIAIDPKYMKNLQTDSDTSSSIEERSKRASLHNTNLQQFVYSSASQHISDHGNMLTIPKPIPLQGNTGKVRREAAVLSGTSNASGAATTTKETDYYDNRTIKLVETTASGMFSFKAMNYNETLLIVRNVHNRLVIRLPHTAHEFVVSKFYMVLHGRGNPSSNDTYGSVFFRQDQPHIDLFVFFAVFFASFFMKLAIIVLFWKVKQSYDAQRSRQQRQKEMRHMASRPFAKCAIVIEPPCDFTKDNANVHDSSTPTDSQHAKRDNNTGARSKHSAYNLAANPGFRGDHHHHHTTSGHHHTSAFRTARNKIGNLGSSRSESGNPSQHQQPITNLHPVALESMDDGIAAIGTVVFQMPGGIQAPVGLSFGSALITTRVFYPSLNGRSATIPRQGSTSV